MHEESQFCLEILLEDIGDQAAIELTAGTVLYRARLGAKDAEGEERPYCGVDIGAPPAELATSGRANKRGQRVLYCAAEERTAVLGGETGTRQCGVSMSDEVAESGTHARHFDGMGP